MNFNLCEFATSASRLRECPEDSVREVAFGGRSNAGKSSAINRICGRSGLARTSRTPGRTQLLNYFRLQAGHYLVDLPGYGFAQVPLDVKQRWQGELQGYLNRRQQLAGLVLLSDIRHPLKEFDRQMLEWARQCDLPLLLLLTKCDKLKRGAARDALQKVQREVERDPPPAHRRATPSALRLPLKGGADCPPPRYEEGVTVQLFSAVKGDGVEDARQWLQRCFHAAISHA